MNLENLNSDTLRRIADIKDQIESLQSELDAILGGQKPPKKKPGRKPGRKAKTVTKPKAKKKGGMSPEGRARIALAQKKRWAKIKREAKKK